MQSLQSLVKSCMFSLKDNYFFCRRATRASVQVVKVFVFVNVTMKQCLWMQICPYARWSIREWQFLMCCVFLCLFLHVFVCECVSMSMCFLLIILPPPLLYKINGSVQHAVLSGLLISDTVFPILPLSGLETHTQSHTHTHTQRLLWSFTRFFTPFCVFYSLRFLLLSLLGFTNEHNLADTLLFLCRPLYLCICEGVTDCVNCSGLVWEAKCYMWWLNESTAECVKKIVRRKLTNRSILCTRPLWEIRHCSSTAYPLCWHLSVISLHVAFIAEFFFYCANAHK